MANPWDAGDATRDLSADEEAERMAKLLEHLRAVLAVLRHGM